MLLVLTWSEGHALFGALKSGWSSTILSDLGGLFVLGARLPPYFFIMYSSLLSIYGTERSNGNEVSETTPWWRTDCRVKLLGQGITTHSPLMYYIGSLMAPSERRATAGAATVSNSRSKASSTGSRGKMSFFYLF